MRAFLLLLPAVVLAGKKCGDISWWDVLFKGGCSSADSCGSITIGGENRESICASDNRSPFNYCVCQTTSPILTTSTNYVNIRDRSPLAVHFSEHVDVVEIASCTGTTLTTPGMFVSDDPEAVGNLATEPISSLFSAGRTGVNRCSRSSSSGSSSSSSSGRTRRLHELITNRFAIPAHYYNPGGASRFCPWCGRRTEAETDNDEEDFDPKKPTGFSMYVVVKNGDGLVYEVDWTRLNDATIFKLMDFKLKFHKLSKIVNEFGTLVEDHLNEAIKEQMAEALVQDRLIKLELEGK